MKLIEGGKMTRKEMEGFFEESEQLWCDKSDLEDLVEHLEDKISILESTVEDLNNEIKEMNKDHD